jgi:hypothetical protein
MIAPRKYDFVYHARELCLKNPARVTPCRFAALPLCKGENAILDIVGFIVPLTKGDSRRRRQGVTRAGFLRQSHARADSIRAFNFLRPHSPDPGLPKFRSKIVPNTAGTFKIANFPPATLAPKGESYGCQRKRLTDKRDRCRRRHAVGKALLFSSSFNYSTST